MQKSFSLFRTFLRRVKILGLVSFSVSITFWVNFEFLCKKNIYGGNGVVTVQLKDAASIGIRGPLDFCAVSGFMLKLKLN